MSILFVFYKYFNNMSILTWTFILDYILIFLVAFLAADSIISSATAKATYFKLKDFWGITMNTVTFFYLPYKTTLNRIDSNSLFNPKFPWFMDVESQRKTKDSFGTLWESYRNLWNYLLSVGITRSLYALLPVSIFFTIFFTSSALTELYRDGSYEGVSSLVYIYAIIVFNLLFFLVLFLLLTAFIKVVYYFLFEVFSGTALISTDIMDYIIHTWNYFSRAERDNKDMAADIAGVHNLKDIDFVLFQRNFSIWSYVAYTFRHGFFTYGTVFFGSFFFVMFSYLVIYALFFSNLLSYLFYFTSVAFSFAWGCINKFTIQAVVFLVITVVCLLLVVAYYTLFERKVMGSVQRRTGPKFVGYWGVLQPISDGLKLLTKEIIIVRNSNIFIFFLAPMVSFIIAICLWSAIPFFNSVIISDFYLGLFFIFTVSSLNVYGVMLGGWASRSQYSLVGSLRATSQVISYELSFGFLFLVVRLVTGSFNLQSVVISQHINGWLIFLMFPFFFIFLILMLAETNRAPYDLAEAEAELVAGFHTEYSAILFALFFLAEYANMFMMSVLGAILFLGGWLPFFTLEPSWSFSSYLEITSSLTAGLFFLAFKSILFAIFFIIVRATLPRYRFDQLLAIGWKRLLPLSFGLFVLYLFLTYFALHC